MPTKTKAWHPSTFRNLYQRVAQVACNLGIAANRGFTGKRSHREVLLSTFRIMGKRAFGSNQRDAPSP
ncbi:hypothetical protein AB1K70_26025 [Bremerella sp. JC770]|uniref:hypothetical protein n=1 Tax=Bremerella sp. JC770 TaxID=3232137 RepID=UPI0034594A3A